LKKDEVKENSSSLFAHIIYVYSRLMNPIPFARISFFRVKHFLPLYWVLIPQLEPCLAAMIQFQVI
jgi:hypothetical protein